MHAAAPPAAACTAAHGYTTPRARYGAVIVGGVLREIIALMHSVVTGRRVNDDVT